MFNIVIRQFILKNNITQYLIILKYIEVYGILEVLNAFIDVCE
jgi:hypothetical protein